MYFKKRTEKSKNDYNVFFVNNLLNSKNLIINKYKEDDVPRNQNKWHINYVNIKI